MGNGKVAIIAGLVIILILGAGAFWRSQSSADRTQEKLDLAVKYVSENNFEEAVLAYNDAIKIDPKQVKAYEGLAKVYTLQGKYDAAKATYDQGTAAVTASEQNPLKLGLAAMYIDKGQPADAEKAYQEIIDGTQNCLEAYWGLAIVYQKQGDNTKAETTLRQAVTKHPTDYRGYNTLALFLQQNNKADDAFNNLIKSLSLEINQQEAYVVLNDMYKGSWPQLQGKLGGIANQQVAAMLEFFMNYASEDNSKAISIYKAKINNQAANNKIQILAAIAMVKTGDKNSADNLINQVLSAKFSDWLFSDIALYYQVIGDNEKARLWAVKAILANGTNLDAITLLQKLNTGDDKKYAAEFLLYNWKPVGMVKEQLKSIFMVNPNANNNYDRLLQATSGIKVWEKQDGFFNDGKPRYITHFIINKGLLSPPELKAKACYYIDDSSSKEIPTTLESMQDWINYCKGNKDRDVYIRDLDWEDITCGSSKDCYYRIIFLDNEYNFAGYAYGEIEYR
ncbi:MAG: tetratricopeptide repeat protein [Syntrophomonas sp.]